MMTLTVKAWYFSRKSKFGYTGNLENERQHLIQQQKLCKARARKYLQETNRRRKALEERRKRWDTQEQLLRDKILQQRREQLEEATQRFQRAHLPPSQRFRPLIKRRNRNMEEALGQIQGTWDWYTQTPSVVSPTDTPSRPPSTKPPTSSKSSPRQTLTAEEAYAKLLHEHRIRKDLELHSFETNQLSDTSISESLLSKDSLENENSNQSTFGPQSLYSSYFLDFEKLEKRHNLISTSAPTSVSAVMLQDQNPALLRKFDKHKQERRADSNWSHNNVDFFLTSPRITSEEQTPGSLALSTLPNEDSKHFEAKSMINSQTYRILDTNGVDADDAKVEDLDATEDDLLLCRSQIISDDRQLTYPSAKNIQFSSENGILLETPMIRSVANNYLNDEVLLHTVKENLQRLSEKVASISINNLNKVSNLMYQTEKPINAASTSATCFSNNRPETIREMNEEDKETPYPMISTYSVCNTGLLKGILKKNSKYSSEELCLYDPGRLILSKQVALAIRDSIELTRAKTKDVVVNSRTKKKLRWFDEVHPESKEQDTANQEKPVSHPTSVSKDHHPRLTMENESSKPGPRIPPAASVGYHFTKEAWADVGIQVSLAQKRADKVKALHTSTRTGGSKIPRRDCNARLGGGPVSSRARKGTIIRPQSATEVIQIVKAQGKIMVPRPPPRTEPTEENNAKQAPATEEAPSRNNSAETYPCPICLFLDCNVNGASSSGPQEIHNNINGSGKTNEKGLCLHITPTDEEIAQLWDGVRSALNTKDAKPVLQKQAQESRHVYRKPFAEHSRQPPVAGSRRFLPSSQPTKQNTELNRPGPRNRNAVSRNEGFERAAQFPVAEMYPNDVLKQNQPVAQIQMPERVQEGINNLSLEENKIMLSLDRLNHQLHCLKTHRRGKTDNNGHTTVCTPLTTESNNHKHQASSANLLHYQKKT
ncbi:centrosomal protein of 126 kDa isoform X2 [Poecilia reticulata]|uniref:centrosomal protein of 126 kDa isoform X2 n=1 Tax=Poecilia reticulata TaxID=8081 RepID=UPI0007EA3DB3|nr:PREDICTED: centrosomal protein of 126 kDa isoform X2 [Poecilia reticulata]